MKRIQTSHISFHHIVEAVEILQIGVCLLNVLQRAHVGGNYLGLSSIAFLKEVDQHYVIFI